VVELRCSIDPETLGKNPEGRKVKGVVHWVSAEAGVPAEVRIYERLFASADPEAGDDFMQNLQPNSVKVLQAVVEPSLAQAAAGERFQFEREGYFIADEKDHSSAKPVFNRILDLKDSFKPS
jgi:glutaminyl-tRNA synthetase